MGAEPERPGLIVLADGAHAAFAAGAVAELARSGARWRVAAGAGLGAQVAALAVIGETEEIERRWRRQAELGCPLLHPRIRAWRQRLGAAEGALVLPDVLALGGWLDPVELDEFLAPEAAGLPERLRRAGARLVIAVHDLGLGESSWVAIESIGAGEAVGVLTAAACFPGGWPPPVADSEGSPGPLWGGVATVPAGGVPAAEPARWDVVCGFPVPAARQSASGPCLFELVQRRDLDGTAERVRGWQRELGGAVRVVAPTAEAWTRFADRDGADLGLEYPLPWEQNGELTAIVLSFGRFVAAEALASSAV